MPIRETTIHAETVVLASCTTRFVRSAGKIARFRLSHAPVALFIAVTALKNRHVPRKARLRACLFFALFFLFLIVISDFQHIGQ